ncbi:magnesium transporter CorA family protein [Legionella hackeliae]|uniref:Magnesium transport protein CorA n=2 Tax=Legionella hackeliae TaxID=449 RepID=A0A0A8URV6_LEGHA|nr:magnesium transporter CorA family protein [Legionella hackeliae]KTD10328.1 magnesium and cobalt transport protein CorA [Legionella hackeliae]CEK09827.1 Mg2+ transporter protein, CorA family protein [Legionella hackeliae]STX49737.1 magnesium and cobalt transport protein CorA [Legionella hackeliae]
MITLHSDRKKLISREVKRKNLKLIKEAIWIDLLSPTKSEEEMLEKVFGLNIPTREEMRSIELSSRLYKQNEILYMTAMMIAGSTTSEPQHEPVSFILTSEKLITVRYIEPQAFPLFLSQVNNLQLAHHNAPAILMGLLEAIVDRLADNLELVGEELDEVSKKIFGQGYLSKRARKVNYQSIVRKIGFYADLNNKVRDSLVTFSRLFRFLSQNIEFSLDKGMKLRMATITEDIDALSDYAGFIANKVSFLLDATLGFISIDQSIIIKIFSVAAVIFLPPTLIASIYGMNFKFMPELSWKWGYLFAIIMMILSGIFSYKFFKYKKWL